MIPAFLDSVGLIALWNERDQWHAAATLAFEDLRAKRTAFVPASYVIAEWANALSRVPARAHPARLVEGLPTAGGLIIPLESEWRQSWAAYLRGHGGSPGLVDHLSFDVMRRPGLRCAFTNDQPFAGAGFEPLFQSGHQGCAGGDRAATIS